MTERRFPLPPAGLLARVLPFLVGGLMPIVFIGLVAAQGRPGELPWPPIVAALLMLPLTGLAIAASVHGRTVVVDDANLQVRRWPLPRRFALAQIDLAAARVAELPREPALRPLLRLFGTRMPGLRSGWFLTRGRKRAYVSTTTGDRLAVLPLRDGRLVLLGVEQPEALLAALHDAATKRR
jgi:hypothetical protein